MSGFWGYNEGSNEPPLTHDPLAHDPSDPDRMPPFLQRFIGAALFLGVIFGIALLAKYF